MTSSWWRRVTDGSVQGDKDQFFGRRALSSIAWKNGSAGLRERRGKLRNVIIHPTGGVSRRPGLRFVDYGKRAGPFGSGRIRRPMRSTFWSSTAYLRSTSIATESGCGSRQPMECAHLDQINWVQSADALLVVHPDVPPQKITRRSCDRLGRRRVDVRGGSGTKTLSASAGLRRTQTTLDPSGTSGNVDIVASEPVFAPDHLGVRLRLNDREVHRQRSHFRVSGSRRCHGRH